VRESAAAQIPIRLRRLLAPCTRIITINKYMLALLERPERPRALRGAGKGRFPLRFGLSHNFLFSWT